MGNHSQAKHESFQATALVGAYNIQQIMKCVLLYVKIYSEDCTPHRFSASPFQPLRLLRPTKQLHRNAESNPARKVSQIERKHGASSYSSKASPRHCRVSNQLIPSDTVLPSDLVRIVVRKFTLTCPSSSAYHVPSWRTLVVFTESSSRPVPSSFRCKSSQLDGSESRVTVPSLLKQYVPLAPMVNSLSHHAGADIVGRVRGTWDSARVWPQHGDICIAQIHDTCQKNCI